MVSVRRSLFASDMERKRFVSHVVRGVCEILREEAGFGDSNCFHGFTRLLSKMKSSFQLSELVSVEGYAEWIDLTAKFTVQCCSTPAWSGNSLSYILGLWNRLVVSIPFLMAEYSTRSTPSPTPPSLVFDEYIPRVSCCLSVCVSARE